jgi:hypothetical protein
MMCKENTRMYTGLGGMSSGELFVLLALGSVVGVINEREREELLGLQ